MSQNHAGSDVCNLSQDTLKNIMLCCHANTYGGSTVSRSQVVFAELFLACTCSPNSKCFRGIASTNARHNNGTMRIENCLVGAIRNNNTKAEYTTRKRPVFLYAALEEFLETG